MSNRDKQFAGFGRAVIMRMLAVRDGWIDFNEWDKEEIEEYSAIVAQAASELVMHTLRSVVRNDSGAWKPEHMGPYSYIGFNSMHDDGKIEQYLKGLLAGIVDMEELPEEGD